MADGRNIPAPAIPASKNHRRILWSPGSKNFRGRVTPRHSVVDAPDCRMSLIVKPASTTVLSLSYSERTIQFLSLAILRGGNGSTQRNAG